MSESFDYLKQRDFGIAKRNARYSHGVLYQGEFETPSDGTAVAVRLHARALGGQGIPVLLRSFSNMIVNQHGLAEPVHVAGLPAEVFEEVGPWLRTDMGACAPVIKHLVISDAGRLRRQLMPAGVMPAHQDDMDAMIAMRQAILANTIVYSVWERDRVDPEIAAQLKRVAEVWVPCRQNAEMLRSYGVERVHVIPHPYDSNDLILRLVERKPIRERRFYSIGRWEPRKGYAQLLEAFFTAFKPTDGATLTIKYTGDGNWPDYPTPEQAFDAGVLAGARNGWSHGLAQKHVTLIGERLKRSKIIELHFRNNIYVCSSHGEAFCLPAFEAKLAGNRLVYVPYGGVPDFAFAEDWRIACHLGPAHPSYRWEPDAQWALYETHELAAGLRNAQAPMSFAPTEEQRWLRDLHSMDTIGAKMLERVREVIKGRDVSYEPRSDAELVETREAALNPAEGGSELPFGFEEEVDGSPDPG